MHLHPTEIDRYLSRDLDERTLAALDAHHSVCLPCARSLSRHAMEQEGWERRGLLGRLVRVERPREARPVRIQEEPAEAA
jgi:hypothetical protein